MIFEKQRTAYALHGRAFIFILIYDLSNVVGKFFRRNIYRVNYRTQRFISRRISHILPFTEPILSKPLDVRRHLRSGMSLEQFFTTLNTRKVRYCILRWFENLPDWEPGEDIDLLIYPDDEKKIRDLFCFNQANQKFDIYSIEGVLEYANAPYYPYLLTKQIIDNAVLLKDTYRVPDSHDYVLSLAYHIVFHKGEKSGIPYSSASPGIPSTSTNKYLQVLNKNFSTQGINCPIVLETLLEYLKTCKWLPPPDIAWKYAAQNEWMARVLTSGTVYGYQRLWKGEILVFILRDWAKERGLIKFIEDWFRDHDAQAEMLDHVVLNPVERENARTGIRGGNWSKGPYSISGGPPYSVLVFYDYQEERRTQSADLSKSNNNYQLKEKIRYLIHSGLLPSARANFIHSSDNETEAINCLSCLMPERFDQILERASFLSGMYETHFPVIKTLKSSLSRSKVELIQYGSTMAVKKTFRPSKLSFLKRELTGATELRKDNPYFLKPLEVGENYIITPYIENQLSDKPLKDKFTLLRKYGSQVEDFFRILHAQGYFLVDFYIGNLLLDSTNKLWVIDLEFLYKYEETPPFHSSYNIVGTPETLTVDLPRRYQHPGYTYKNYWRKVFKLRNL